MNRTAVPPTTHNPVHADVMNPQTRDGMMGWEGGVLVGIVVHSTGSQREFVEPHAALGVSLASA